MTWTLDPAKPGDLVHTSGFYVIAPGEAPGTQRITYQSQTDSGRRIPGWIQRFLTTRALKGYLEHIKAAAEGQ